MANDNSLRPGRDRHGNPCRERAEEGRVTAMHVEKPLPRTLVLFLLIGSFIVGAVSAALGLLLFYSTGLGEQARSVGIAILSGVLLLVVVAPCWVVRAVRRSVTH